MASDIVADARRWLDVRNGRVSTHSENCHQWHAECLVARLVAEVERSSRDDHGLAVTCAASRHAEQIAEELIGRGSCDQLRDEGEYAGRSILSAVRSLYAARAEITRLTAEVERHRMTEVERVAAAECASDSYVVACNIVESDAHSVTLRGYLKRTATEGRP